MTVELAVYPPLPLPSIKPVKERVAEAMKFRGQISNKQLNTMVAAIYGSARDCGDNSLDVTPQILPPDLPESPSKIPLIQATVAKHFNLTPDEMLSRRRVHAIVRPRQIAMYLSRHLTHQFLSDIARQFGRRDHTAVSDHVRKIERLVEEDATLAKEIEILIKKLELV